jgi:CheY-like chemotaxis protein
MGYILLVDDNATDRENIDLLLGVSNYRIEAFSSWEAARSLFDTDHDCDLVITRVKMSEIHGNDIAQYVRNSLRPQTPILGMSSPGDNIDRNLFNSVLEIPFKLGVLKDSVASFAAPMVFV